jgi:hypothetical protein
MEPTAHETKSTGHAYPSDFKHRFLASTGIFLVDQNSTYRLEADHSRKLIYLTLSQTWHTLAAVPELEHHLRSVASAMVNQFGMLIDFSALTPDSDGTILVPAIPARGAILNAGLINVANVIPYNCEELVHGSHSFSINSVRMRPFINRVQAESWLTTE